MKREYRILKIENDYYAQVRIQKKFLFFKWWDKWYRISQYGLDLYDELRYPSTNKEESLSIINKYKHSIRNKIIEIIEV